MINGQYRFDLHSDTGLHLTQMLDSETPRNDSGVISSLKSSCWKENKIAPSRQSRCNGHCTTNQIPGFWLAGIHRVAATCDKERQ